MDETTVTTMKAAIAAGLVPVPFPPRVRAAWGSIGSHLAAFCADYN